MTTEEIEKAAEDYSNGMRDIPNNSNLSSYALRIRNFEAGAEFVNQHWQEKTRWIPIGERLPAFEGKRRTVLVKTGDDLYSFLWIIQEVSLSDFECQDYTHWKEIE